MPLNPLSCQDSDSDSCDDCSFGVDGFGPMSDVLPANDGTDTDSDGLCDLGDPDIDNDSVLNLSDLMPLNPFSCQDSDADSCDDCSIGVDGFGPLSDATPDNDGTDTDGDGLCDLGDPDSDNDMVDDAVDNCPNIANTDQADLDQDGVGDVCDDDIDGDQMPNSFELANGLDPFNSFDQSGDRDGDGFSNIQEYRWNTDVNVFNFDDNENGLPDIVDLRRVIILPIAFDLIMNN